MAPRRRPGTASRTSSEVREPTKPAHEVTIAHGLFTHGPRKKLALRGATIVVDDADYERGLAAGAFVIPEEPQLVHGELPAFDYDADDVSEIQAWMRSAAPSDVTAALEAAAAEGRDIAALMLSGELSRGSEVRPEVVALLTKVDQPAMPAAPVNPAVGSADPGGDAGSPPAGDQDPVTPPDELPASTRVEDILAWVGDDVSRARTALGAELEKPGPRPTLTGPLEQLIAAADQGKV